MRYIGVVHCQLGMMNNSVGDRNCQFTGLVSSASHCMCIASCPYCQVDMGRMYLALLVNAGQGQGVSKKIVAPLGKGYRIGQLG